MAENKKSFLMYCEWKEIFDDLSDSDCVELIRHIFSYVNDENPTSSNPVVNAVFIPIKQAFKRDLKKYESIVKRNQVNGKKGGRPKNPENPVGYLGTQKTQTNPDEPKKADNDNDNDKVIDLVVYKEKLEGFKKQIGGAEHGMWIESMYRKSGIPKNSLSRLTDKFIDHLIIIEKKHETLSDFKNHFYNWITRQETQKQTKEAL